MTRNVLTALYWLASFVPTRVRGAQRIRAALAGALCSHVDASARIEPRVRLCRELRIGKRSGLGRGSVFIGGAPIILGDRLRMGPECLFITGTHRIPQDGETFDRSGVRNDPITVQDDVFIGARVIVLGGVTVGRGAAVGAGAVVTKDVAPGAVVAGNPARTIRVRSV